MQIGAKIRNKRKRMGLTQQEICEGICSITYLSKVENGKLQPKEYILRLLCKRLCLEMEEVKRDDFKDYFNHLKSLYNLIVAKDISNFQERMHILEHPSILSNPILNVTAEIILLNYYLSTRCEEKALPLKKTILSKQEYVADEVIIWFYKTLGYSEYLYGNIEKCSDYLYEARRHSENSLIEDPHLEYFLALVNTRLMLIGRSIHHAEKALEIYNKDINFNKIIECKLLLGINFNRVGQFKLAESYFLNIANTLVEFKNHNLTGKVYHNLGYLYLLTKAYQDSIKYLQKALRVKKNADSLNTLYLLAYNYKTIGDSTEALDICNKGLELAPKHTSDYYKIFILKQSLLPNGLEDKCFFNRVRDEIIPFFIDKDPVVASECYYLLARLSIKDYKYKKATHYFEKAFNLNYKTKRKELLF